MRKESRVMWTGNGGRLETFLNKIFTVGFTEKVATEQSLKGE